MHASATIIVLSPAFVNGSHNFVRHILCSRLVTVTGLDAKRAGARASALRLACDLMKALQRGVGRLPYWPVGTVAPFAPPRPRTCSPGSGANVGEPSRGFGVRLLIAAADELPPPTNR